MSPHLLQAEIINNPELFVEPDPELPLALLDQKEVIYLIFCFGTYCEIPKLLQWKWWKFCCLNILA
jgi:hypothetical protein